jgi:hypothetical protein
MIELSVGFGHAAPETANPGGFDRPFGRGAPDAANEVAPSTIRPERRPSRRILCR